MEGADASEPHLQPLHGIFLSPTASATLTTLLADSDPLMDKLEETARNLQRRLAILKRKHTNPPIVNNSNTNVRNGNNLDMGQGFPICGFVLTVVWLFLLLSLRGWLTWPWM